METKVFIDGNYLYLRHPAGGSYFDYEISLRRLDSPKKVFQWLIHLLQKNWVTREMLADMIRILEKHFKYNLHEFTEACQ